MWGSRGKNLSKCMGNSSTIDPYNSTITGSILMKNVSLKRYVMTVISSKQEEAFKATNSVVDILKLHTGPYKS